jgi:hypothetical protein
MGLGILDEESWTRNLGLTGRGGLAPPHRLHLIYNGERDVQRVVGAGDADGCCGAPAATSSSVLQAITARGGSQFCHARFCTLQILERAFDAACDGGADQDRLEMTG